MRSHGVVLVHRSVQIRVHLEGTTHASSWHFHTDVRSSTHTEQGAQPVLLDGLHLPAHTHLGQGPVYLSDFL